MNPVEQFQKEHGAKWALIVREPAFNAALLLVNAATVQAVTTLTNEEIETRGKIILADLRGRLAHENALIDLSVIHPDVSNDLPEATYPNPEDEAEEAADAQDSATGGAMSEAHTLAEFAVTSVPPTPTKRRKKRNAR